MNKEIRQSYAILKKVFLEQAFAGIELNKTIHREYGNCNTKLVTKIVYGVIEKNIQLDYVVKNFVKNKPNLEIELLLKLGVYIIMEINSIPNFACVNEIVEITKSLGYAKQSGFVNATLKNVCKSKINLPSKQNDLVKYLSINYSYPIWLVNLLLKEHDENFVEELLSYNLTTLTHIRILNDKISTEGFINILKNKNIDYEKSVLENTLYVEYSELLRVNDLYDKYIVQGLPSIITASNIAKNSKNILDLCASPGGKSVLIAQSNPKSKITACDVNENRVDLIRKYAETYNIENIEILINDATILREDWVEKFDTVLCDVSCSNLGIANKKPDVLLNRSEETLKEITELQLKILETASKYVKKGGVLIYSTCSIMKEENEMIVGKFLKNNKNFKISEVNTFGVEVEKFHNLCTFYPHISKCEGFFIGRLIKE